MNFLFKENLDTTIAAFLSEPQRNIAALYKILDRRLSTGHAYVHRLLGLAVAGFLLEKPYIYGCSGCYAT